MSQESVLLSAFLRVLGLNREEAYWEGGGGRDLLVY